MKAIFQPGRLKGTVTAPPSKSMAHRAILCTAMAGGGTVEGVAYNEDVAATLDCIRPFGILAELHQGRLDLYPCDKNCAPVFPCRESGSTLRFCIPLALTRFDRAVFTGSARLMERGIGIYEDLFASRGIQTQKDEKITVSGSFSSGSYAVPGNVSSQFISGLLLALPLLRGDSTLSVLPPVESRPYMDMTLAVMKHFGVSVLQRGENEFYIPGGQHYGANPYTVEGDWSNGAFLLAFARCGDPVTVTGLREDSLQGDKCCTECFARLEAGRPVDLANCPDLGPVLFALAAIKGGGRFLGTRRLRIKESDRAAAMAAELKKCGIPVRVEENAVTVEGAPLSAPQIPLNGHNDHRIVMALSLVASRTGGILEGVEAVRKSYPDYFSVIQNLGVKVKIEDE